VENTITKMAKDFDHSIMEFKKMANEFNKNESISVKQMIEKHATNLAKPLKALTLTGPDIALYKSAEICLK
jgi:hypothetical protein